MDKRSRNTIIISIVALAIVLITVTYAYFSARITGIESASTISLTAGRMEIIYTEGNEEVVFNNIYPREEAWATKTFTLTGYNTTDSDMKYKIGLNVETNTFPDDYLTYDLRMVSSTNGTPIATKTDIPINGTGFISFGIGTFTNADADAHNYELKIYFKDSGEDQNDGQDAVFNAKISINEYIPKKGTLLTVSSYDINYNNCMTFASNNSSLEESEIEDYCHERQIFNDSFSINKAIKQGADDFLINEGIIENVVRDSNNNIISYDINQSNCVSSLAESEFTNSEITTICSGGLVDSNSWSIEKDIKNGNVEDYVTAGAIENVVRDQNDNITSYTINESNCKALLSDWGNTIEEQNTLCSGGVIHDYKTIRDDINDSNMQNYINAGVVENTVSSLKELQPGDTYIDGQYTYKYKKEYQWTFNGFNGYNYTLKNIDSDGWSVILTDVLQGGTSTEPVTTELCESINGKPIVSMAHMFHGSKTSNIDINSLDTSNVTNMESMFEGVSFSTLDLSSLDFSNVTNAKKIASGVNTLIIRNNDLRNITSENTFNNTNIDLSGSKIQNFTPFIYSHNTNSSGVPGLNYSPNTKTLNLSNTIIYASSADSLFNQVFTVNYTPQNWTSIETISFENANFINASSFKKMFACSKIDSINMRNVQVPNVNDLTYMFDRAVIGNVDLSNFSPVKNTTAAYMFIDSDISNLVINSFNTTSITNMGSMFSRSKMTSIDLSGFNTSNVTDMGSMFARSAATSLNLSSFDTTNVINMASMFKGSAATTLDLSSFNTSNVEYMEHMFEDSAATTLDLSTFDTSKVTNMTDMFKNSSATLGYARTETDAGRFNGSTKLAAGGYPPTNRPAGLSFVVKP